MFVSRRGSYSQHRELWTSRSLPPSLCALFKARRALPVLHLSLRSWQLLASSFDFLAWVCLGYWCCWPNHWNLLQVRSGPGFVLLSIWKNGRGSGIHFLAKCLMQMFQVNLYQLFGREAKKPITQSKSCPGFPGASARVGQIVAASVLSDLIELLWSIKHWTYWTLL